MNGFWFRVHCAVNRRAWKYGNPTTERLSLRGRILWALNDFAFNRWWKNER